MEGEPRVSHGRRTERRTTAPAVGSGARAPVRRRPGSRPRGVKKKRKFTAQAAWREARALIVARKGRLALGLLLMLVNRLVGLVLPATSKYLIDDVIGKRPVELLCRWRSAAGAATLVQAVTSFALSQVLGVAAQRAITDMRRRVQAHVAPPAGALLRLDAEPAS